LSFPIHFSLAVTGNRNKGKAPIGYHSTKIYLQSPFDIDKSFETLRKDLYDLLLAGEYEDYDKIDKNALSDNFKAKILSVYYPDKYFCVFSRYHILKIKNLLEIELSDEDSIWEIKKSISDWQKSNMPKLNTWSFMRALYNEFENEIRGQYILPVKQLQLCDIDYISAVTPNLIVAKVGGIPNYEDRQKRQSKAGRVGEDLVFNYEKDKLRGTAYKPTDYYIKDISKHYDILSYDLNGNEIHIEVKTKVKFRDNLDFYLTDYEYEQLITDPNYAIYYVTDINTQPKLFILDLAKMRSATPEIELKPKIYRAQHIVRIKP